MLESLKERKNDTAVHTFYFLSLNLINMASAMEKYKLDSIAMPGISYLWLLNWHKFGIATSLNIDYLSSPVVSH